MIKIVKDEPPLFIEILSDVMEMVKNNKTECLLIASVVDGKIYTDYVKGNGTSMLEVLGCCEVLKEHVIQGMCEVLKEHVIQGMCE